jgi:hypothetical protein
MRICTIAIRGLLKSKLNQIQQRKNRIYPCNASNTFLRNESQVLTIVVSKAL